MFTKIKQRLGTEKGFTLVELIVVIAIIGVLAAIAVPKFASSTDSAAKAKIQADLRTIDSASALYYANNNKYAADVAALATANLISKDLKPPKYKGATVDNYAIEQSGDNIGRAYTKIGEKTIYSDTEWTN